MKSKTALGLILAFSIGFTAGAASAQETQMAALKAQPAIQPASPFAVARFSRDSKRVVDREFAIEFAALVGAWTVDTISTHGWIADCSACAEIGGLARGSRSTLKIMGENALVDAGLVLVAYEWKQRVHNKYLHPLWRVPMAFGTQGHVRAIIHNLNLPSALPAPALVTYEKGAI